MPYHVGHASSAGVHEGPGFVDYGGVAAVKLCSWHRLGTPFYAQGGLWAVRGCPKCEEKIACGKVPPDAPKPREFQRLLKRARVARSSHRNPNAAANRRAFYAATPVRSL